MSVEDNLKLMKTLDDSWNAQDWETFKKRHAKNCVVYWPNQAPTHGIEAHEQEGIEMFKTFPDNRVANNPYKIMFGQGDCSSKSVSCEPIVCARRINTNWKRHRERDSLSTDGDEPLYARP